MMPDDYFGHDVPHVFGHCLESCIYAVSCPLPITIPWASVQLMVAGSY
jgi:hypothetical protein